MNRLQFIIVKNSFDINFFQMLSWSDQNQNNKINESFTFTSTLSSCEQPLSVKNKLLCLLCDNLENYFKNLLFWENSSKMNGKETKTCKFFFFWKKQRPLCIKIFLVFISNVERNNFFCGRCSKNSNICCSIFSQTSKEIFKLFCFWKIVRDLGVRNQRFNYLKKVYL